jgi:hypothetical protein
VCVREPIKADGHTLVVRCQKDAKILWEAAARDAGRGLMMRAVWSVDRSIQDCAWQVRKTGLRTSTTALTPTQTMVGMAHIVPSLQSSFRDAAGLAQSASDARDGVCAHDRGPARLGSLPGTAHVRANELP